MQELDDMELVKRAQAGNAAAVGELYDRHQPRIFRYIRFKVAHTQVAQDLTGEVFLRMVDHLSSFEPRGVPFSAWLYRIATNLVIKEGQLESKQPLVPLVYANHISQNHENPTQVVERRLENEWLWQGLDKIDENQREIIILRFVVGLSLKETAGTLDRTVAAVKTLQHRGILALQAALAYE
jgi:RNA polymerase sigma-70 factor (ECF subfamily)